MRLGLLQVMQNWHKDLTDYQVWQNEIGMALEAERLGFESVWCVEHHFERYGMCGDNMQYLSYLAGRTSTINIVPGAVILPWNDPLRVIEKMAMLEYVAPGRVALGVGRGLAKSEYRGMRQDMNESRGRFDESIEMILRGLDTGIAENDGTYYQQPRVEIRPRPLKGYRDSLYCVAMTPDSQMAAARCGATMMTFIQYAIENHVPGIEGWREEFAKHHPNRPMPAPKLTDVTLCHEDEEEAERLALEYIGAHFGTVMEHYDFAGDHFKDTKGYEAYQQGADLIKAAGLDGARTDYINAQNWGTPDQIIEKYHERRRLVGDFEPLVVLSYAGMPDDVSRNSLRLFGEKIAPAIKDIAAVPAGV
jgi:alkanesulfonate monooxygenase SsuD/methylene tetrahydromethanopterin reductase-like flavin-dependent oxidoreductase (luciferase family)